VIHDHISKFKFSRRIFLLVTLLFIILLGSTPTHGQPLISDTTVNFDQYDFTDQMTNRSETVSLWTNSSQIFDNKLDQVTLKFTVVSTDHPVEASIMFVTKDIRAYPSGDFGSSSGLKETFSIGNLLAGSSITITIDWKSVLNETALNNIIWATPGTIIRQYQIMTALTTTTSVWHQDTTIHVQADVSSRQKDTGENHFTIDASEAIFANATDTTPSTNNRTPGPDLPIVIGGLGIVTLVIRRKYQ